MNWHFLFMIYMREEFDNRQTKKVVNTQYPAPQNLSGLYVARGNLYFTFINKKELTFLFSEKQYI